MPQDTIMLFEDYKEDSILTERIRKNESYDRYLAHHANIYRGDRNLPEKESSLPQVPAFINAGRWMWHCLACDSGVIVDRPSSTPSPSICPVCMYQEWVEVVLPDNWKEIEEELLKQPGFRLNTAFRYWEPDWDMDYLRHRTHSARVQMDSGVVRPRSASIGSTRLWSVGEVLTANRKNTHERQVMRDLAGRNGPIGPYEDAIILYNATTAQRDALTAESGMMLYNETTGRFNGYESTWSALSKVEMIGEITLGLANSAGKFISVEHNLGIPPQLFTAIFEKVAGGDEAGYTIGDFVSANQGADMVEWTDSNGSHDIVAHFIRSDENYVHVRYHAPMGGVTFASTIRQKQSTSTSAVGFGSAYTSVNYANWRLKFIIAA